MKSLCSEQKWLIVMLGGGRFSAAIFKGFLLNIIKFLFPSKFICFIWIVLKLNCNLFLFLGKEAIVHKTFHSYTVRAKQGGSQSTQDRSKGGSKSAGASLRRYNEASQLKVLQRKINYT